MDDSKKCRTCGEIVNHNPFHAPNSRKRRMELSRALGYYVTPEVFDGLCRNCQEKVTYLAAENRVDEETERILTGDGQTKANDVQGD